MRIGVPVQAQWVGIEPEELVALGEPPGRGAVVPRPEVVPLRLVVPVLAAVAERVQVVVHR